jgi:hypothetical protein
VQVDLKGFPLFQHALSQWWKHRKSKKLDSVLDYAKDKYGNTFVEDVKALQGVVYVFLPVPIFWSLFDQQVRGRFLINKLVAKPGLPDYSRHNIPNDIKYIPNCHKICKMATKIYTNMFHYKTLQNLPNLGHLV